jgi:hypothetical protein
VVLESLAITVKSWVCFPTVKGFPLINTIFFLDIDYTFFVIFDLNFIPHSFGIAFFIMVNSVIQLDLLFKRFKDNITVNKYAKQISEFIGKVLRS